ncbi:MAG: AAA family ATPase [candidate division Zixibacteria bacterium]|nr:AAA family ATPase [candidate division Zixibacteria bacterium]
MTDQRSFYRELSAYIPQSLLTWYGSSPAGQIHRVSRLEGVLVCVDASGFTALTKKLALSGRGGSEDLTILLNIFFEKMSQTVFACDGDVLKFAGDAFWAYFPASFDPQLFMRLALGRLEEVNDSSGFTREHPLNIHVGAERGCFSLASLGDPSFRLEVEPIGPLVHAVYKACDYAGENELYAGPALGKHCQLSSKTICNDETFFIVAEQPQLAQGVTGPASREFATVEHPQLTSYIPQEIVARLKSAGIGASLQSEHRQVVSLFAYFEYACDKDSSGPVENIERLCETLGKAFAAVRKMRGSVARIDPYGKGHKLLMLFGAPQKLEQDELHAAACAREVIKLADKHISIRIGASFGPLYCGDVGAQRRREYTVMGEGANMAARLMAKAAWGQILCDERLRSKMPEIVRTERLTLALKGIGEDVPCFALTTIEEEDSAAGDNNEIIGQEFELGELKNRCRAISNGIGNVTLVTGEAGSGKTSLLTRLSSQQSNDCIFITCKNSVLYGRNWLARKILSGLHETWDQSFRGSLTEYVLSSVDRRWIPMLGDLIERPESENEWTRGLGAELRLQKLVELYLQLVSGLVTAPRRIIVDDFDRADESSQGLVYEVAKVIPGIPAKSNAFSIWERYISGGAGSRPNMPDLEVIQRLSRPTCSIKGLRVT